MKVFWGLKSKEHVSFSPETDFEDQIYCGMGVGWGRDGAGQVTWALCYLHTAGVHEGLAESSWGWEPAIAWV